MVDRGTQKPMIPMIKWKNQAYRRKREMRADIIEIVETPKWNVLSVPGDQSDLLQETVHSKKMALYVWLLWWVQWAQHCCHWWKNIKSLLSKKKNKKKGTEWQNNLYWQFLEKLQHNSYWGKNTRTCTSKEERSRRWQKTPAFHCCYGLSIPCFTEGLSLFIQNSYYSISSL